MISLALQNAGLKCPLHNENLVACSRLLAANATGIQADVTQLSRVIRQGARSIGSSATHGKHPWQPKLPRTIPKWVTLSGFFY